MSLLQVHIDARQRRCILPSMTRANTVPITARAGERKPSRSASGGESGNCPLPDMATRAMTSVNKNPTSKPLMRPMNAMPSFLMSVPLLQTHFLEVRDLSFLCNLLCGASLSISSGRSDFTRANLRLNRMQSHRPKVRFGWFIGGLFAFRKRETTPLQEG
jgi:hypothetical protein